MRRFILRSVTLVFGTWLVLTLADQISARPVELFDGHWWRELWLMTTAFTIGFAWEATA